MSKSPWCAWCAGPAEEPQGVYLALIAQGRSICVECGRFTLHCSCPKAGDPVPERGPKDVRLTLISSPGLVD